MISRTLRPRDLGRVSLTYIARGNKARESKACDILRISEGRERGKALRAVKAGGRSFRPENLEQSARNNDPLSKR